MLIRNVTIDILAITDLIDKNGFKGITLQPGQELTVYNDDAEKSTALLSYLEKGKIIIVNQESPNDSCTIIMAGQFIDLKDVPDDYVGHSGKAVVVNSCANGLTYAAFAGSDEKVAYCTGDTPDYLINKICAGSNITLTPGGTSNKYITISSLDTAPVTKIIAGSNVTVDPTSGIGDVTVNVAVAPDTNDKVGICSGDTPGYLTSKLVAGSGVCLDVCGIAPNQCVMINVEAGHSDVTAFTQLSDVPATYGSCNGCLVAVNAACNGLEFIAPTSNYWLQIFGNLVPACNTDVINHTYQGVGTYAMVVNNQCNCDGLLVTASCGTGAVICASVGTALCAGVPTVNCTAISANGLITTTGGICAVDVSAINYFGLPATDFSPYIRHDGTITFSCNQSMGGYKLTSVSDPLAITDVATKGYVDSLVQGLNWQDQVTTELTDPSGLTPVTGDRYLIIPVATGDWTGFDNDLAQWDGTGWQYTIPHEGFAVWLVNDNILKTYNGDVSAWVTFGSTILHSTLQGLTCDDHTQYLKADGSRAITGNLCFNGNCLGITNCDNIGVFLKQASGCVEINGGSFVPRCDGGTDLGNGGNKWKDIWACGCIVGDTACFVKACGTSNAILGCVKTCAGAGGCYAVIGCADGTSSKYGIAGYADCIGVYACAANNAGLYAYAGNGSAICACSGGGSALEAITNGNYAIWACVPDTSCTAIQANGLITTTGSIHSCIGSNCFGGCFQARGDGLNVYVCERGICVCATSCCALHAVSDKCALIAQTISNQYAIVACVPSTNDIAMIANGIITTTGAICTNSCAFAQCGVIMQDATGGNWRLNVGLDGVLSTTSV